MANANLLLSSHCGISIERTNTAGCCLHDKMASKVGAALPFDPILRAEKCPRAQIMRDGVSRTRENHQRLASTTMLMENGEDNGEGEDGAGNGIYILFILKPPGNFFVCFCSIGFSCCTYIRTRGRRALVKSIGFHTYPESRERQICEFSLFPFLVRSNLSPTLTRIFPCFRFDVGVLRSQTKKCALSGKKSATRKVRSEKLLETAWCES